MTASRLLLVIPRFKPTQCDLAQHRGPQIIVPVPEEEAVELPPGSIALKLTGPAKI